jgi:hypothetical protein
MLIDVELLKENEDGSAVYSFELSEDMKDAFVRFGIMQAIKAGIEAAKELAPDYEGKKEWVGLTTDERGNILRTSYADMYDAAEVIEELLKEKNT